jgi:hypothetical protein
MKNIITSREENFGKTVINVKNIGILRIANMSVTSFRYRHFA